MQNNCVLIIIIPLFLLSQLTSLEILGSHASKFQGNLGINQRLNVYQGHRCAFKNKLK